MTFNFCPSDLVKLFNNLVGANISVAPTAPPKISENNYKVCDLILDLSTSYEKLVRKKKAA